MQNKVITDMKGSKADISVVKENNVFTINISDYVSIEEYISKMSKMDKYNLSKLISNSVLWNSHLQKVNKGKICIMVINNRLYNILINDNGIIIDERVNKNNITEERVLTFNSNDYSYFSSKQSDSSNTFYTKYYYKEKINLGDLNLSDREAYDELENMYLNLKNKKDINNIFDIEQLKRFVLNHISLNLQVFKK